MHYLKFRLPQTVADALQSGASPVPSVALEIDHPAYSARATLPPETVRELAEDLL